MARSWSPGVGTRLQAGQVWAELWERKEAATLRAAGKAGGYSGGCVYRLLELRKFDPFAG